MTNHNWQSILKTALTKLRKFAGRTDFDISLQKIFGVTGEDTVLLKQAWLTGNFGTLPNLEIIASSQINNARGAFAAATNTLYLSEELIKTADLNAITAVFLEEYGHYLDSILNYQDTAGDEGEYFAAVVMGEDLSPWDIARLQTENDQAVVTLAGQAVAIEQNLPVISVVSTPINANENNTPGSFTLRRSNFSGSLTVNYTIGGTATNGTDYLRLTGTATFPAGSTTTTITVTPTDDLIFEGNETVTLALATGTGYTLGTPQTATVTIADNDAIPQVSINDVAITEGNSGTRNATFTVSLSNPSSQTISVNYQTVDDDATTANNDYVATTGTITFTPGQTTKTLPITINGDTVGEINEAFTVLLTNAVNATLGKNEGIGIIRNDDSPGVTVTPIYTQATESGAPGIFQLNRTGSITKSLNVNYSLSGTATNGTDYSTLNGVAAFASGSSTAIIFVNPTEDTIFEGNETVIFNLLTGTGYTVGTSNSPTITIVDNDPRPEISINDANVTEGDSGTTTLTFEVTLTNPSSQTITVDYQTSDLDATVADADYLIKNGQIIFNPGEVRKTVDITVNGDTSAENDELFKVNLLNPAGALIKDGEGYGKIHNDDTAITVIATDADAAETPPGTTPDLGVFTITRQGVTNIPLTVYFSLTGTGINGTDYTSPATATFGVNSNTTTVNVTPTDDNIFEGNEDVILTLNPGTGYSLGTDQSATVTITDDDPQPQISISDVTLMEGDSGTTTFNFAVTLSNPSSQTITVDYQTSDVDTVAGTDYVIKNGLITFNPGETIQPLIVIVNGDTLVEDNETFKVNLSNPVNATIGVGVGTGTINNDDVPTLTVNNLTVVEGVDNNAIMTFTLSTPSNQGVSVNYSTTAGTATANSDYTPVSGTLTIPAGATTATLSIPIVNDNFNEPNETFNLALSNPVGAVVVNASPVITITDTIESSTTFILPAGVENLTLTGTTAINGTGNTGNNVLTGNSANNILAGGDGNDTYSFNATTVLGNDTIQETSTGGVDVIDLTGTTGAATLNLGVTTIQTVVTTNLRLTLTANIENIIGGNGADRLTGNPLDNSLVGGLGNDNLRGNGGNDSLTGGVGDDILTGGLGTDHFIYSSSRAYHPSDIGSDQISDFTTGDKFVLSKITFDALQSVQGNGLSQGSDFAVVTDDDSVNTQAAFIVYSSGSGYLFYNQNGTAAGLGTGGAFADLFNQPTTLATTDFIVIP
ncbi:endo-1,3-1,4-beta-glycanase ExsH [Anabaena sp. FACHB-1250]|uniref:Calx-beta domain-containing protein n=1 Tax=Anabaena sp. FACHB-1250 TaxID=2692770 RepID=UPI0016808F3A|nr:Calx-beta domain-containing protein [Anabaena sp. FACHB-1250]MBD2141966.1 endo-1,3-1,4-beta-glycanase ExsH [Anabaena sp. FACHB-1250]